MFGFREKKPVRLDKHLEGSPVQFGLRITLPGRGILLPMEGLLFLAGNTCLMRGFPASGAEDYILPRKPEIPEVLPARKGLLGIIPDSRPW
jgi:hypothetical protein